MILYEYYAVRANNFNPSLVPIILATLLQLNTTIAALRQRLTIRQKEAADLKAKYNFG